jgi:hypothetical protein
MSIAAAYLDLDGPVRSFSPEKAFNVIGHKQLRLAQSYLNLWNCSFSWRD